MLEKGKDTTAFFESGVDITIGIDSHKAVVTTRKNQLDDTLRLLKDNGMDFVLVEGFKTRSFPKVVLGDLKVDSAILRNPTVTQVLNALHLFKEY